MADYAYDPNDGKLHLRYSTLVRCTPGQIDRVIAEMDGVERFESESMAFGTIRHDIWQQASLETGKPYHGFKLDWPVSHVEHEFTTEILPGVIIHSRPDLVCADIGMLPDYKTVLDGKNGWQKTVDSYRHESKQRQLKFYAFQLGLHGIRITKGAFLCEVWNAERDTILDYKTVEFPITFRDIAPVLPWVKDRVALLAAVLEEYKGVRA
jgi:hypothetical protein